jgi:putative PIG3 family NAD(P)H quinone oxidoreductase
MHNKMTIPKTMQAIEITTPGAPEMLRPTERPVPALNAGEVLIRVVAAGVNRPDVLQRRGAYAPPPGVTDIPGLEVAGEIVQCAPDVTIRAVGEQVCALVAGGGYAQYVAAPSVQCLPIPTGLTLEQAAGVPETFFTVYGNIVDNARLQAGEWLLVHGGSSGIGTTAIRLGKALGAKVLVTAGSKEKCAACVALGADLAINYKDQDFVAAVLEATGQNGVDVTLDMVGGSYIARDIQAAATDGRISLIAVQGGIRAELDLMAVLRKRVKLMGFMLRPQSVARKGRLASLLLENVWPLFATHELRLPVHARFPLAEAARAHTLMESGEHIGKILLLA